MTDAEQESPVQAPLPIKTFVTSVARIEQIAHPFTRVTFRGGDLAHFRSIGPDQFLYLLLPPAGGQELTIDSSFDWNQYQAMPELERPIGAYYTVRRHRPERAELDIDIVRHGHDGQVGAWLRQARPGAPVALWGPRMAYDPPPATRQLLLLGDETALPAIAAILDSGPTTEFIEVIAELDQTTVFDPSPRAGFTMTRIDKPRDRTSDLPEIVRHHRFLPETYVWGAGEAAVMSELRTHLRNGVGLSAEQVSMIGYWRR